MKRKTSKESPVPTPLTIPQLEAELSLEPLQRISRDLMAASKIMTIDQTRFAVDLYYQIQKVRQMSQNQVRSSVIDQDNEPKPKAEIEPSALLTWTRDSMYRTEQTIKAALDKWSDEQPAGAWMKQIVGIGPVIAAGLLAHIDITKAKHAGALHRFAGLDPSSKWEKGQKRPWNAKLKTLCWKLGDSFNKFQNHKDDIYGKILQSRQTIEQEHNEQGDYRLQANAGAQRVGKTTEAYKYYNEGKLPPGHLFERRKRYAVKIFLSHLFQVMYAMEYGKVPPAPYVIQFCGHSDMIDPPFWAEIEKKYITERGIKA